MHSFLYYYRDIGATIYPVLEDTNNFEAQLNTLLQNRAISGGPSFNDEDPTERPFGMSIAFLGLLFAVLASGCQSSHLPSRERELTSQVYGTSLVCLVLECVDCIILILCVVCCSYQCLRMTNFLSHPTIEAIQTLLIIGNVLAYNMNPGTAYILLGKSTIPLSP